MAPELLSPGDGDSFTEGQGVTLSWSTTGETYTVEIMGGPSGTQNFGPFYGATQSFYSLAVGYTYSWRVQAHNSAGPSSWSATRTFTIRPREPQYINATVASCSQINLTWFDSSSYEDGYNIYRNGAWLASVGAGGTTYQNTGLSGSTTYTYYVKAYRGNVESNASGSVQQTTSTCVVIPPPPDLLEPPDGYAFVEGQEITLFWTATGDQYSGEVWGGSDGTIAFGPQSGTSINIGSNIPGYTYSWRVKAQNSAGPSDWSGTRTFKVLPGAPTNLVAQAPACDAVNLSWTDTSDYEDGFIIYRNDAPLASVGENVTSYTDTDGLSGETPYTYTIKAYRNTFLSNLSNSASVTTPICPPLDTEAPILDWVAPVGNEQTWDVVNETLELTVSATDNVGVNFVYFDRWDAVNEVWVEIGYAYTSPFTVNLDASTLNLGWNNVFAVAVDSAGNSSTWEYIWLNRLTPQPDLKPYTPPGYYAPGVPSSVTGTYVPNELHAGQVTYFDWHFINDGWATAPGTFYVELWVDDTRYVQYPEPDFGPKQVGGFDDWTEIITTPGWHYVQVIVDPDNTVIESDETNNTWGEWFYWTPSAPHIDDMETEASYWWDATGLWHLATETSNYPNSYSGVSSWWYGQEDTGNYNTGAANSGDLTSPEIYIPDSETYYLRFKYWYQTESKYSAYDERWLQASIDYGEFFNVYQLYDDNMSQWHNSQVLDLSGLGGHILQIRFHFDTKDDYANAYRGWYIDDFEISTTPPPACTDGYEYNGSMEYATTISYGQTLSADICANGDYDYYKFDAQAGDFAVFDIKAFEFSSYLDSFITLLAADGTILATNDDDGYSFDSKLGYAITDSGTYYLRVRDYYHPSYGGPEYLYDIHLYTDANDPVSAEITSPLTGAWMNPSIQTITVTADDAESGINRVEFLWHSADWQNDEWIWFGADSWGSDGWSYDFDTSVLVEQQGGALYVWAFDYAGRYLGTSAWNLGIDRTTPTTTLYITSMYGGAPFRDFHISWEGSDNLSGIASYDVQVRDGLTGSWTDYYYQTVETYDRFIGEDGHTYYFQSRARDAAGNVGDYVGGNGQDYHTVQLCTISADSYESDNSSAAAKTLTVGSASQAHNFHAQSDEDWVKFTVQNNKIYTLSTTNTGSYADTVLSLYGVDGTTLLQFNDDYDGLNYASLIAWRPPASGTYYAEIYHWDPYGYGCTTTYTLSLSDISPTITSLTPASVTEGSADVPLTVAGANFTVDSVIQWNGTDLPTVYVSANELTTTIPASNVTLPGTASITVFDPEYDGITSNAVIFTINEWVNTPPVAVNNSYSTNEDTSKTVATPGVLGNDTDIDEDTLTAVKVTNPAHGSVTLNANGSFTYTPNANYNGADSFTYKANDGTADSNIATVNLTITTVNDTPVANDQNVSTSEDIAKSITLTASDVDGNSLTWIIVGNPAHGALSGTAPNLTYTPSSNWSGTDAFTFKVNDGTVDSNTATVTINVTAVNDPPVANNQTLSATEDTAKAITLTALDVEGAQLSWTIVSNPSHGSLTGTAPSITYTPTANYNGADTFTFKVNDGQVDSNTATIAINISAVNDIPVAVNNSYTTNEDAPKTVAAPGVLGNDTDADGNTLTAIKVTNPAHGSVTISTDGSFTYTPAANWSGTDSFTYKANDGTADSNVATVTLTVNAVNDPPVADNQSVTTLQDTPKAITLTASDIEGSSLIWVIVTNPAHGTLSGTLPDITYTPTAGWSGVDTFTFKVNDGTANSNVAMVTITVTPINTAPVANDDAYNANEDTTLTIAAPGVLGNDTDADNDLLTAILVTGPSYGTLTLNGDGSFTYRPNADWFGVDTFSYSVYDGADESNLATVTITVADVPESRPIYLPLIFR